MFENQSAFVSNTFSSWGQQTLILIENWKWLAIILLFIIGWALKLATTLILKKVQSTSTLTKGFPYFAKLLLNIEADRAFSWILTSALWLSALKELELHKFAEKPLNIMFQVILSFYVIKTIYLIIDAGGKYFENYVQKNSNTIDSQFVNLTSKSLKVFVIVLGILVALQNFGINVMSILAGLGLGGLALALAAQDTAANLFGSITIIFDKPFKVGDVIRVGSQEGVVDEVGFRSTRIITANRSIVTIPNSVIAKENIENLGVRPNRRLRTVLGLTYNTKPDQIEIFCKGVADILNAHPLCTKEEVTVYFTQYGAFSLDITVTAYFNVFTYADEARAHQEVYLQIYQLAQSLNVEFAFPTQTIVMQK